MHPPLSSTLIPMYNFSLQKNEKFSRFFFLPRHEIIKIVVFKRNVATRPRVGRIFANFRALHFSISHNNLIVQSSGNYLWQRKFSYFSCCGRISSFSTCFGFFSERKFFGKLKEFSSEHQKMLAEFDDAMEGGRLWWELLKMERVSRRRAESFSNEFRVVFCCRLN